MKPKNINHIEIYDKNGDVAIKKLFTCYFQSIPNHFEVFGCEAQKIYQQIKERHKDKILLELKREAFYCHQNEKAVDRTLCLFSTKELLDVDTYSIDYYYEKETLFSADGLIKIAKENPIIHEQNIIKILVSKKDGYSFEPFEIKKIEIPLIKTYNNDLLDFDRQLSEKLARRDGKGIVLLYGKPGTGKSTYLKHLISSIEKNFLFIPASLADALSSPNFIAYLLNEKESIIIIEDAEKVLKARDLQDDNGAVSSLLNISDGLLSDVLKMQIICTFNTELKNIDRALLRPSRLIGKYEFKELHVEKARELAIQLGYTQKIEKPIRLAELFSGEIIGTEIALYESRALGFKSNGVCTTN